MGSAFDGLPPYNEDMDGKPAKVTCPACMGDFQSQHVNGCTKVKDMLDLMEVGIGVKGGPEDGVHPVEVVEELPLGHRYFGNICSGFGAPVECQHITDSGHRCGKSPSEHDAAFVAMVEAMERNRGAQPIVLPKDSATIIATAPGVILTNQGERGAPDMIATIDPEWAAQQRREILSEVLAKWPIHDMQNARDVRDWLVNETGVRVRKPNIGSAENLATAPAGECVICIEGKACCREHKVHVSPHRGCILR